MDKSFFASLDRILDSEYFLGETRGKSCVISKYNNRTGERALSVRSSIVENALYGIVCGPSIQPKEPTLLTSWVKAGNSFLWRKEHVGDRSIEVLSLLPGNNYAPQPLNQLEVTIAPIGHYKLFGPSSESIYTALNAMQPVEQAVELLQRSNPIIPVSPQLN